MNLYAVAFRRRGVMRGAGAILRPRWMDCNNRRALRVQARVDTDLWGSANSTLPFSLFTSLELVADGGNGDDQRGTLWVGLQFLTQACYVDVHSTGERCCVITPHFAQDFFARKGRARVFHEVKKEMKLARREIDGNSIPRDLCTPNIDADRSELIDALAGRARTAQQGLDSSQQFKSIEWLG